MQKSGFSHGSYYKPRRINSFACPWATEHFVSGKKYFLSFLLHSSIVQVRIISSAIKTFVNWLVPVNVFHTRSVFIETHSLMNLWSNTGPCYIQNPVIINHVLRSLGALA